MDDEMQTPIEALHGNNEQDNYQEQLRGVQQTNMRTQMEPTTQVNQQQFVPMNPPVVQSRNNMYMFPEEPSNTKRNVEASNMNDKQREFILIVVICSILYSMPVQEQIKKVMPTLYNTTYPTIVGTVLNGALIGGMFYVLKNVNVSF